MTELPPQEVRLDWLRFLDTKPTLAEIADWCEVKAWEIGWDFFELSMALSAIRKPEIRHPEDDEKPTN